MTFHPENQRVWSMSPTQTGNTSATSAQFASLTQAPRRGCISRAITARPVRRCQRALSLCRWSFRFRARNRIEYGLCAQFPVTGADLVKRKNGTARIAGNKTRVVLIGPKAGAALHTSRCPVRRSRCSVQSGRPLGSMQWRLRPDARAPASRPMSARIDCGMPVCRPRSVHLVRARLGHASPRDLRPGTRARGRATA